MAELPPPESAVARFRDGAGAVVGAGFLVDGGLVVTCTHVVAAALGRDEGERPDQRITLEFPVRGPAGPAHRTATVVGWTPTGPDDRGDIAVLRLDDDVPDGVRPARLSPAPAPVDAEIDAFGFPAALGEHGLWARGRIRKEQATGWLQIDSVPGRPSISPGFSGTPVFDVRAGGVVGMVVAVVQDAQHTTAFLNPARTLVAVEPMLQHTQASPYRGLAAFAEEHAGYFRGRDELITAALDKAAAHPLLVLSGPSGSGKSSLAHAGLLPRLRARGRTVTTVRVSPDVPAASLLADIVAGLTEDEAGGADLDPGRIVRRLRGDAVLVDQLEEADPGAARTVVDYLYRLAEAAGLRPGGEPRLLVVLTLRGRQLDAVATGETAAAMQAGLVLVTPMTTAQLREAVSPPGAVFEPGLVERLVGDAGTEPGTLPLLAFTLDRLWARRELGVLTHAGYDELGGVTGAMARYADQTCAHDPARARRLLVRLTRPDDDGVFRRRPLPLADLPPELRPALDRLVARRLIVVGPGAAGEPVAELAHEALIRDWPRLRGWLEEDRDFRTWQEGVRRAARDWLRAGREPDTLLRGAALADASRWAEARGSELGRDEEQFVRASAAHDRRRGRRARSVTAALVILTLLAGVSALVAQQQTGEATAALRTSASRLLADDAERFRLSQPGMSLQLALAAWHAWQTPEAYGALLTQYSALEPVDRLFRGLTADPDKPLKALSTSRDGSVAVVADDRGEGVVWRGLGAGDPQRVAFPGPPRYVGGSYRVSPSGRYLAYANDLGGVYVRDITRPELPPVDLAPSGPDRADDPAAVQSVQAVRFAPDDTRLAVLRTDFPGTVAELRVWDLRTREAVPNLPRLDGDFVPTDAFFGPVPGSIVLGGFGAVATYDLAGWRHLRTFREVDRARPIVAGGGALVVSCGRDDKLVVRDAGTGRQVRSIAVQSCTGFEMDANGEFGTVVRNVGDAETTASLVIVDPRTGASYRLAVPPADVVTGFEPIPVLAGYRDGGGPGLLLGDGSQLYRIRPGPAVTLRSDDDVDLNLGRNVIATPDGNHRVLIDLTSGRLTVVQVRTDKQVATVAAAPLPRSGSFNGVRHRVTDDSRRLLIAHSAELVVYALPGLTVEHRLRLPVPPDLGGPPSADWASSVVPVEASEAIVLYAGVLTRWNVVTGARLGEPVALREGQDQGSRRRAAQLAFASGRRPDHPDQVTVVLPDSTVQLWSLDQRRAVASFAVDAALMQNASLFNPDGSLLAVHDKRGYVSVWPVGSPRTQPWNIPTGIGVSPLGFTPGAGSHLLTVQTGSITGLAVWDRQAAKRVALITAPLGSHYTLRRDELGIFDDGYARRLRLDPGLWFSRLCALAARPYTAQEAKLVRERGAPISRPCP